MSDQSLVQKVPLLSSCSKKINDEKIDDKRCLIHVRYLSIMIAVIELAIVLYQMINGSWHKSENAVVMTMAAVLFVLVIILLFLAIFYQIGALLVPHIAMQALLVLSLLGMAAFALYALFSGASLQVLLVVTNPEAATSSLSSLPEPIFSTNIISSFLCGTLVLFFVMYVTMALINMWCLRVVVDCYYFLSQQRLKRRTPSEEEYCAPKTIQLSLFPNQIVQATDF